MAGKFITFEGGEGSGKSTQAEALARKLDAFGIGVVLTREPGGSPGAEIIRHIILSGIAQSLGEEGETLLFAAARADHVENLIRPSLTRGKWVVCDRFLNSTRVYQGVLGKVSRGMIKAIEKVTVGETMPDLTFILDVPIAVGLARARERRGNAPPDRFEKEDQAFHEALNAAFRDAAVAEPARCVMIDGTRHPDIIASEVWRFVRNRLHPETAPMTVEDIAR